MSLRARAVRAVSALMAACALATGCATTQLPPPDLDLSRAAIVFDASQPVLILEGLSSKEFAVGVGAAGGFGTGVLVAAVGCLGTGPFYPLCLSLVLPATAVAGGVGGAIVGGVVSDTNTADEPNRGLLRAALEAASYPALLAEQVQKQARERFRVELPLLAATAPAKGDPIAVDASARTWWIELTLTRVSSGRTAPNQPFALRAEGRLKLRRSNEPTAVYEVNAMAMSDAALTTAGWGANGAEALRGGLDNSVRLLADKLLSQLAGSGALVHSHGLVSSGAGGDM